jgi:hypothetical protein
VPVEALGLAISVETAVGVAPLMGILLAVIIPVLLLGTLL